MFKNPFLIGYKTAFLDKSSASLCCVMECATDGDLQEKIKKMRAESSRFPEETIWLYLA